MPTYEVDTDQGTFEVDLDKEPESEQQLRDLVSRHLGGESQPTQTEKPLTAGEVAKGFVTNIPESAVNYAKGIYETVRHPLQTAEALGDVAAGGIEKLVGAELQPEAKSFDALVDMLKNRYGSIENTKKTIATDPVGFMSDLSVVLGGTGAALKGMGLAKTGAAVSTVGSAVDPIANIGRVGRLGAKGLAATGLPERLYGKAVKFSTTLDPAVRANRIRTGLVEAIVPTEKGLNKLRDTISGINDEIAGVISKAAKAGDTVQADEIIKRLDDLKSFYSNAAAPQQFLDDIDDLALQFKTAHGANIPVDKAQKIKQTTYAIIRKHYGELKSVSIEGQKAIARGIKEELAVKYPELSKLNARDTALLHLEDSIERAVGRIDNREMIGIGTVIASTAGAAATGTPKGMILTGIGKALATHPRITTRIAFALQKARDKALIGPRSRFATAGQALFQAGRIKEETTK